jgi:hypothetical protein
VEGSCYWCWFVALLVMKHREVVLQTRYGNFVAILNATIIHVKELYHLLSNGKQHGKGEYKRSLPSTYGLRFNS